MTDKDICEFLEISPNNSQGHEMLDESDSSGIDTCVELTINGEIFTYERIYGVFNLINIKKVGDL